MDPTGPSVFALPFTAPLLLAFCGQSLSNDGSNDTSLPIHAELYWGMSCSDCTKALVLL